MNSNKNRKITFFFRPDNKIGEKIETDPVPRPPVLENENTNVIEPSIDSVEREYEPSDCNPDFCNTEPDSDRRVISNDDDDEKIPDSILLPNCWSMKQYDEFQKQYPWLRCVDGKLKCITCCDVKDLGVLSDRGVMISQEWADGFIQVTSTGDKNSQQKRLRNKIYKHRDSEAHGKAEEIRIANRKRAIQENFSQQLTEHQESTQRIFRTVYNQIKTMGSFKNFESQILLQKLNKVDVGVLLHSRFSCANIVDFIAKEMRKRIVEVLLTQREKFAILVDESDTVSKHATMIIYIRSVFSGLKNRTIFLDLVEVKDKSASGLKKALIDNLESHGITEEILQESLVGFDSDGASAMLGKANGLSTLLQACFPNIIIWHCSAHRLQLAVGDAVNQVQGVDHFRLFMDCIYTLYHRS